MPGKLIYFDGHHDTLHGHARRLGINPNVVDQRVYRMGLAPENYDRIFHVGTLNHSRRVDGSWLNWADDCRRIGLDPNVFYQRVHRGWTEKEALAAGPKGLPPGCRIGLRRRRELAELGIII